jgi:L-lysine 2,3-aminomutase
MEYKAFTIKNLHQIKQLQEFPEEFFKEIELLSAIYPVKTNNYVIDELIDWKNVPDDPIFRMNFPNKEMLIPEHYERITEALKHGKEARNLKQP